MRYYFTAPRRWLSHPLTEVHADRDGTLIARISVLALSPSERFAAISKAGGHPIRYAVAVFDPAMADPERPAPVEPDLTEKCDAARKARSEQAADWQRFSDRLGGPGCGPMPGSGEPALGEDEMPEAGAA